MRGGPLKKGRCGVGAEGLLIAGITIRASGGNVSADGAFKGIWGESPIAAGILIWGPELGLEMAIFATNGGSLRSTIRPGSSVCNFPIRNPHRSVSAERNIGASLRPLRDG